MTRNNATRGVEWWAREVAELQKQLRDAQERERAARAARKDIEANLGLAMVALEQEVRANPRPGRSSR